VDSSPCCLISQSNQSGASMPIGGRRQYHWVNILFALRDTAKNLDQDKKERRIQLRSAILVFMRLLAQIEQKILH
jgi:hypothetical protein